ncbi:MAG: dTDP-4-amino-4,6-dideoxygalactose transaminase [Bacteroidota bacterium]
MIPFNKPYITGNEIENIRKVIKSGKLSGGGDFSEKCLDFLYKRYNFSRIFLTSSGSQALEIIAILLDIQKDDEIILPSYTYVTTANVFAAKGAKLVFADSCKTNPNINTDQIENLITSKTKAIIAMHYGGVACDMSTLTKIVDKKQIFLIEDAALGLDAFYKNKPLGSLGHFGFYSFHDTKNITSGEGGLLIVNDMNYQKRAETIFENGTNRNDFIKGTVDKYEWVDFGSSYKMSELNAAFLYAQFENLEIIQSKRKDIWNLYYGKLQGLNNIRPEILPVISYDSDQNYQIFYLICNSDKERLHFQKYMVGKNINCHFHYQALHRSCFIKNQGKIVRLKNSEKYSDCLIRLPLYPDLSKSDCDLIIKEVFSFFTSYQSNCFSGNHYKKISSNNKNI